MEILMLLVVALGCWLECVRSLPHPKYRLGGGRAVPVKSHTGVWMDRGPAKEQNISGVRVGGGLAVIMTEESD